MSVHRLKTTNQAVKWKVGSKPYGGKRQALTQDELDRLFAALKTNRHGHRDYMVALVTFLHGLRVSELVDLRWEQVDFNHAVLHVRRAKKGTPATHPIIGDEMRALRRLQREQEPRSPFVFTSERGSALSHQEDLPR